MSTTLTREIWIDAPQDAVWQALADIGGIYKWNPNVVKSYVTGRTTAGVGAQRHCDLTLSGATVEERVVSWQEGEKLAIEIYDGQKTPPWHGALATFTLKSEKGGTRVIGRLDYRMKFGPLGGLMNMMMVKPKFGQAWSELFAGLKYYLEQGHKVAHKRDLPLDQLAIVA